MLNNLARIASAAQRGPEVPPMVETDLGVVLLFLVPLGGTILYATGLLLLYFERLVAEKHELATHDELTGLLNRRAIVAAGKREVALAIRARQPLTVAYVDVDFFKDINDALGHEAGDRVLADLSSLLRDTCRSVDLVGRLGGEEFALVLPGLGPEQIACVGERLLAAVRGYRFLDRHPVTVSLGFAALSEPVPAQAWADLLARADAALYRAKQLGRDRYCIDRGDAAAEAAPTLG
jgi:diguanylate cyclase (GGDEF)-like protein